MSNHSKKPSKQLLENIRKQNGSEKCFEKADSNTCWNILPTFERTCKEQSNVESAFKYVWKANGKISERNLQKHLKTWS